jgi:hypothetical protein
MPLRMSLPNAGKGIKELEALKRVRADNQEADLENSFNWFSLVVCVQKPLKEVTIVYYSAYLR